MQNEIRRFYKKNWEDVVARVAEKYNDPTKFWAKLKRSKGSNNSPQHLEKNDTKFNRRWRKEEAFREIWSQVFTITPEENAD